MEDSKEGGESEVEDKKYRPLIENEVIEFKGWNRVI